MYTHNQKFTSNKTKINLFFFGTNGNLITKPLKIETLIEHSLQLTASEDFLNYYAIKLKKAAPLEVFSISRMSSAVH